MQLTIVNAVPFDSAIAFWATKVENNGESAMTTIPQMIRYKIKNILEEKKKIIGERMQRMHDNRRAEKAVFFIP